MYDQFSRTALLLGQKGIDTLQKSSVIVFGVGGVGGYVVEALARSGVGRIDLVDNDEVALTNLNRQIIATHSTIGRPKVEVAKERIHDINPQAKVHTYQTFYLPENANLFDLTQYDYVVDAIDTVSGKIGLIVQAKEANTPIISSMGAGNKLDPTAFRVADIYKTNVCPLAKVMRRELKKRGINHCKVVYSEELPITPVETILEDCAEEVPNSKRRQLPGSNAFVPSVVGLIIAGEVINDLTIKNKD